MNAKQIAACVVVVVGLCKTPAQSITGIVSDAAGKPLAGVEVYGSRESCCPAAVQWTVTRANGEFILRNPGPILHFRRIDLQPRSMRIGGNSPINAVLASNESPMIVSRCEGLTAEHFGYFLRFGPSHDHRIQSGRDVDYKSYGFKTDDGGLLESWFGPTASNIDAFEERYLNSKSFSERAVVVNGLGVIGIEASGVYENGKRWRWIGANPEIATSSATSPRWEWHLAVATNGIGYDNASTNDQKAFDAVMDSACAAQR